MRIQSVETQCTPVIVVGGERSAILITRLRCNITRSGANIHLVPLVSENSPCDFDLIPKIAEPIRRRRFATREDVANPARQQSTRFSHGAANAEADGIQRLPHRWQRVVTVAGDYIEGF
ncbi:uncharacterized protein TNCV_115301 [Trichonephila clavipes]|nr:uncharacterized protein TNCV_115301 [Trichonephila clavipes]